MSCFLKEGTINFKNITVPVRCFTYGVKIYVTVMGECRPILLLIKCKIHDTYGTFVVE